MTTEEYFENQIFEENKDSSVFEKVRLNIFNTHETLSKTVSFYNSLSKAKKYELCYMATYIAVHTELQRLNETEILFKKEKQFYKYSINRPNKKYEIIELFTDEPTKTIQIDYEDKSNNTL